MSEPASGRSPVPVDLVGVAVLAVFVGFTSTLNTSSLNMLSTVLGSILVFFGLGYATVAAIFPERQTTERSDNDAGSESSAVGIALDSTERIAYSVAASIAVAGLVGIFLNFTRYGIRPAPVRTALVGTTLAIVVVAAVRRIRTPVTQRYDPTVRTVVRYLVPEGSSRPYALLNVALIVVVLVAAVSVGYAAFIRGGNEQFTELYVLSAEETVNGTNLVAGNTTTLAPGETTSVVVGIENREQKRQQYTLVVQRQRVAIENDQARVLNRTVIDETALEIASGDGRRVRQRLFAPRDSERVRFAFLLYRGDPPLSPTIENAYREVHLWLVVATDRSAVRSNQL